LFFNEITNERKSESDFKVISMAELQDSIKLIAGIYKESVIISCREQTKCEPFRSNPTQDQELVRTLMDQTLRAISKGL
jgi:hypothetical protein